MNTKIKEAPSWEVPNFPPDFATGGPAGDFEENIPAGEHLDAGTQSAFSRIEDALRDVAYQLGESESASGHASAPSNTPSQRSAVAHNEFANRSDEAAPASVAAKQPSIFPKKSKTDSLSPTMISRKCLNALRGPR